MNTPSSSRFCRTKSPGNLTTAQGAKSPRSVGPKLTPFKFGNSNNATSPMVKSTRKVKDENTKPLQTRRATPTSKTPTSDSKFSSLKITGDTKQKAEEPKRPRTPMSSSSKFNATPFKGNSPSTPRLKRPTTAPTTNKEKSYLVEISDDIVVNSPRKLNFENSTPTSVCITSTVTFETPMAKNKTPIGSPLSRTLSSSSIASRSRPNSSTSSNKLKRSRSELRLSSDFGQNYAECKDGESSRVSVGVRVRPLHSREHGNAVFVCGQEVQVASDMGALHRFNFDHCFPSIGSQSSQEDVYEKMVKPLVDNAFDGYNACLFAYGQTGSGKTYSMMGTLKEESGITSETGIIPRFCQELISRAQAISKQESPAVSSNIQISYLEVYNEKINDLLVPNSNNLKVREHPINGPYVADLSKKTVTSYKEIQNWIDIGNKKRATAATEMNDKSSRSHSLFTVVLSQTFAQVGQDGHWSHDQTRISQINLVDLAGSERISHSSVSSDRLREGVSINRSLLTLGKVITALIEKRLFVPYRESVLTWLLKDSLGGNSRTTMLATISPSSAHIDESLATLRYASQARSIVNTVHVNEAPQDKLIRELKAELERLREVDKLKELELQQKTNLWPSKSEKTDQELEILNELKLVNSENAKLKEKELKLQSDLDFATSEIIKIKENESYLQSKLKLSNTENLELKKSELKLQTNLEAIEVSLKNDLESAKSENTKLLQRETALQSALELANSELSNFKKENELAKNKETELQNELKLVNYENSKLKEIEFQLQSQLDSLKIEIKNKEKKCDNASNKELELENELKLVNCENLKLKEIESQLQSELEKIKTEICNLKENEFKLELKLNSASAANCEYEKEKLDLQSKLETADTKIAELNELLIKSELELAQSKITGVKGFESIEIELKEANSKISQLKSEINSAKIEIKHLKKLESQLNSEIELAKTEISQLKGVKCQLNSELESAKTEISKLKDVECQLKSELESAKTEISQLKGVKCQLKSELESALTEIVKFKEIECLLQSQLKMADTENSKLRKHEKELMSKLEVANAESVGINEINRQLISELDAAKSGIKEHSELEVNLELLKSQITELENAKCKLALELESANSETSRIKSVEGQLQSKLKLANAEIAKLKEQKLISKLESANSEATKMKEAELSKKLDSANDTIAQLKDIEIKLKTKLKSANSEIEQLKILKKNLEEKYSEKEKEFSIFKQENFEFVSKHKEILAENATLKRDLNISSKRLLKNSEKNKCLTTNVDKLEIILKMVLENKLTAAKEKELLERAIIRKDIDAFDYVMNLAFPHHWETLIRKARSLSELYIIPYDFELHSNQVEIRHLILRAKAVLHHAQFTTWVETLEREKKWMKNSDKNFPWEVDFGDYFEKEEGAVGDEEMRISSQRTSIGCLDPVIWRQSLIRRHLQGIKDDSEVLFKYFPNSEDSRIFSILCRIKASVARLEEATKDNI